MKYMNIRIFGLLLALCLLPFTADARKPKEVKDGGVFHFRYDYNISAEEAKHRAEDDARNELLMRNFGTNVHQTILTDMTNCNGQSESSFSMHGGSEVDGRWIKNLQEPKFECRWDDKENCWLVTIEIHGLMREIMTAEAEYEAHLLRSLVDVKHGITNFFDGDTLYMYFRPMSSGYVAIYMDDFSGDVLCLLPYTNLYDSLKVEAGKDYLFYHSDDSVFAQNNVVELQVQCATPPQEAGCIYVIFSPNHFSLASYYDKVGEYELPISSRSTFFDWLSKCKMHDMEMVDKTIDYTIRP